MKIEKLKLRYGNDKTVMCQIPCSLFSVLYANGYLPHPYKDDNERLYIEEAKVDCIFETEFDFIPRNDKIYVLTAGCIDTISKLYLNGKYIGDTDNAFYPKKFELEYTAFKKGKNTLQIKIISPIRYLEDKTKKHYVDSQMDTPKIGLFGRASIRKPQYSFGWDWGASLPDMGIYAPIIIEEKKTELDNFVIKQVHTEDKVVLAITSDVPCKCTLYSPNGKEVGKTLVDAGGGEIEVHNPELWWCNNLGGQPLYMLKTEYEDEYSGEILTEERKIGLRSIEITQECDEYGREFGFVLNGKKIFAMGANYIPEDHIVPWYSEEKTEKLLKKCKETNFNMLRVWGGGFYANEHFYDLCDELGIIVWQDCAFACQAVYLAEDFEQSVKKELEYQIRRIAKHTSLGLICGNNEIEDMIADRAKNCYGTLIHRPALDAVDYLKLFEHIIPDICSKYAPDTFYWPCSPSSGGGFYMTQNENYGDMHLWEIWEKDKPLDNYKNFFPRFCSEFGVLSYPNIETLNAFSDVEITDTQAEAVQSHFKKLLYCPKTQELLDDWIRETFGETETLDKKLENSQILQGRMIKGFIEHMRIHRNRCRGSLYWQLNDSWQTVSWSTIDYFGNEKLSHKLIKEAYAPIIVATERTDESLDVYISNESCRDFNGVLSIDGQREVYASVNGLESKKVLSLPIQEANKTIAAKLIDVQGKTIWENSIFPL